jgi:hypothetical protein
MSPSAEMSAARRAGRLSKTGGLPERLPMARIMDPECVQDETRGWWVCHGSERADGASPSSGGRRASGCGHRSMRPGHSSDSIDDRAEREFPRVGGRARARLGASPIPSRARSSMRACARSSHSARYRGRAIWCAATSIAAGRALARRPLRAPPLSTTERTLRLPRGSGRSCCWARATTPAHTGSAADRSGQGTRGIGCEADPPLSGAAKSGAHVPVYRVSEVRAQDGTVDGCGSSRRGS